MPKRWEFFDHTADVGIVGYGETPAEALASAGVGLFGVMTDLSRVQETAVRRIEVAGQDLPDLLVAWLNELLYIFEVDGLVFARFEVELKDEGRRLVAIGYGERFDASRHEVRLGVKAATHHLAVVEPVAGATSPTWRAMAILDV